MKRTFFSNNIRFCLGYHPELIDENVDFLLFEKLLNLTSYIGEIGFDKNGNIKQQIAFLNKVIDKVNHGSKKILNIHTRGLTKDVIEILNQFTNGIIIFHWFSGNEKHYNAIKKDIEFFLLILTC